MINKEAYKRLTRKDKYGHWYTDTKINDRFMWSTNGKVWERDLTHCAFDGEAIDRLAELEDKIMDGTIIERPSVRKGDSIWIIRAKRDYLDGRYRKIVWRCVDKIFLNNDNTYTISTISVSSDGYKNRSIVKSTTFKKSWFLTKAEAEARLKELQKVKE